MAGKGTIRNATAYHRSPLVLVWVYLVSSKIKPDMFSFSFSFEVVCPTPCLHVAATPKLLFSLYGVQNYENVEKMLHSCRSFMSWLAVVPIRPCGHWTSQYVPYSRNYVIVATREAASLAFEREYVKQYNMVHGSAHTSLREIAIIHNEGGDEQSISNWIRGVQDITTEMGGTCDDICGFCSLSCMPAFEIHEATCTILTS